MGDFFNFGKELDVKPDQVSLKKNQDGSVGVNVALDQQ